MLRSVEELFGYMLWAKDGEIGKCKDFLFDDTRWAIRYMVADTRKWLPGRKVLISPISLDSPVWETHRFPVKLAKEKIRQAPPLDEHAPVSRQYEIKWFDYYGWPTYWTAGGLWGAAPYPSALYLKRLEKVIEKEADPEDPNKSHLRSTREVQGYEVQAVDGKVGRVDDFIMDEWNWILRYLVVDTGTWGAGQKVLMAPSWVKMVDWAGFTIWLAFSREAVRKSPGYHPSEPVNREYEQRLHDHYARPLYEDDKESGT